MLQVCWASVETLQQTDFQEELKGTKVQCHERHTALTHCCLLTSIPLSGHEETSPAGNEALMASSAALSL